MTDGNADIERELQVCPNLESDMNETDVKTVCPPREIRDFRMARIVDAREGDRDATRVGMLNIWEAKSLGEGMLREGGRYLVSSLMPARQGDWGLPTSGGNTKEIYLHTRRDTRWQEVGVSE
jgi:breast cancer 2 susceptibility protein